MSKHGLWTVIPVDKKIIKKTEDFSPTNPGVVTIDDNSFWSSYSNINAIQFTDDDVDNDQVEHLDGTPHSSYDADVLGDFRTTFINRFDAQYLADLQSAWDNNNVLDVADESAEGGFRQETEAEKITRLGARPTSYTSA